MRNPNGYGTVVKLSGNRRRPYAVRKTIGFNDKGYPIYKAIGYTDTKEAGLIMLAEYNRTPYDIDMRKLTVKEVYEKWSERDFQKMSKALTASMKAAWQHCKAVYSLKYSELKAYQMQDCIDKCGRGYSTKGAIKNLFHHLDHFALELDIIIKCNSNLISSPPVPETQKNPFTEKEIIAVWEISDAEWVDSVLCLLYMGWRISELLSIKISDVDIVEKVITSGTKTKSGKNRVVPIHPRLMPFIQKRYSRNNGYLFGCDGACCSVAHYYKIWNALMEKLNIRHTPHECRHTFRSQLDSLGGNKVCIDMLMGHKSSDIGERIYTHKTMEELRNTILLLK